MERLKRRQRAQGEVSHLKMRLMPQNCMIYVARFVINEANLPMNKALKTKREFLC